MNDVSYSPRMFSEDAITRLISSLSESARGFHRCIILIVIPAAAGVAGCGAGTAFTPTPTNTPPTSDSDLDLKRNISFAHSVLSVASTTRKLRGGLETCRLIRRAVFWSRIRTRPHYGKQK